MPTAAPILLISLGTSQAIVPEAFLLPDTAFVEVHVLTTAGTHVSLIREWFRTRPEVQLTITRVEGFDRLETQEDHNRFEEALFRWYQTRSAGRHPHVCLSGGYKSMSAAMQKAAALFGAVEVFHVLLNAPVHEINQPGPKDLAVFSDEIERARREAKIHWVRLGGESGWPQFRKDAHGPFPLELTPIGENEFSAAEHPHDFRNRVASVVRQSQHIADAWDQLASLPFPHLATWAPQDLAWLQQPVDPVADRGWVAQLPKIELHCHLGGFATAGNSLMAVRAAHATPRGPFNEAPSPAPGWPLPASPIPLDAYCHLGDANGTSLLKDPGCLKKQCELLYEHLIDQRVVYAEIRCSPANYITSDRSPWRVLSDIQGHFDRCMTEARRSDEMACHVNLIIIGTRKESGDYRVGIARHLALAISSAEDHTLAGSCRVVGVDLAGYEDKQTRAHYFREEFTGIHRCGLALTVHAGENDDAEGIWRAVFELNARRLGYALSLKEAPDLMRSVADRGVGVEMCPYANCQIRGFRPPDAWNENAPPSTYPLKTYLEEGIRVSVNTDNIGISAASLTDNLLLAARLCPTLTRLDLLRLQANAIQSAFIRASEQRALSERLANRIPPP